MNTYLQQLAELFKRLPMQQRLLIGGAVLGAVLILGSVAWWANRADYALLFGELSQSDAGQVVEKLQGQGVDYQLRQNGSSVFVPREQVYELRLSLASEGVISDGQQGWELFDQGAFGLTDFIQKINKQRALEGEIARSITILKQIENARVHLVTPDRRAFIQDQAPPSASVLLKMNGTARLSIGQVEGIAALVAGAVQDLDRSDVTVLDTQGNVLTTGGNDTEVNALSTSQLDLQRNREQELADKAQRMLDTILGKGNAIVQVTATMDFNRSISSSEIVDPESQTVISEEKIDEDLAADGSATSSVRNYVLSTTTETNEKAVGTIDRLSVGVVLNQRRPAEVAPDEEDQTYRTEVREFTNQEVADIDRGIRTTVGFNTTRGDDISISQFPFQATANPLDDVFDGFGATDMLATYLRYGLVLIALIIAFLVIRRTGQQVTAIRSPEGGRLGAGSTPYGNLSVGSGGSIRGRVIGTSEEMFEAFGDADSPAGAGVHRQGQEPISADMQVPAGRQLAKPAPPEPDPYVNKLEVDALLNRSENPLFDQVRMIVDDSPADAGAVIRQWMQDPLAV